MFKSGDFYDMEILDTVLAEGNPPKSTPGLVFSLKVFDGEEAKAFTLYKWLSETVFQSGKNQGKTQQEVELEALKERFGLPESFEADELREFYKGKKGRVLLEDETYKGKTTLKAKDIFSTTLRAATVNPTTLSKLNAALRSHVPVSMPTSGKGKSTKTFFNKKKD